jgi:hypothetical protein
MDFLAKFGQSQHRESTENLEIMQAKFTTAFMSYLADNLAGVRGQKGVCLEYNGG